MNYSVPLAVRVSSPRVAVSFRAHQFPALCLNTSPLFSASHMVCQAEHQIVQRLCDSSAIFILLFYLHGAIEVLSLSSVLDGASLSALPPKEQCKVRELGKLSIMKMHNHLGGRNTAPSLYAEDAPLKVQLWIQQPANFVPLPRLGPNYQIIWRINALHLCNAH